MEGERTNSDAGASEDVIWSSTAVAHKTGRGHQSIKRTQDLEKEILSLLQSVIDPDLNENIVNLRAVKDMKVNAEKGSVTFELKFASPVCSHKNELVRQCEAQLKKLSWVSTVNIRLGSLLRDTSKSSILGAGLKGVAVIVAVASCKGGVGKSTVAVNLAFMLKKLGAKVGLLDADVYGPSLPILIPLRDPIVYFSKSELQASSVAQDGHMESVNAAEASTVKFKRGISLGSLSEGRGNRGLAREKQRQSRTRSNRDSTGYEEKLYLNLEDEDEEEGSVMPILNRSLKKKMARSRDRDSLLEPLEYAGVKLMSYGFIKKSGAQGFSALRGPFASSIVEQLARGTAWGELDYLIIDLPPGTGDIQISLSQALIIDACVVITTPQTLSTADAERGVKMFAELGIPTICVVENMSFYECENCHTKHILFRGSDNVAHLPSVAEGVHVFKLPLAPSLSQMVFEKDPQLVEKRCNSANVNGPGLQYGEHTGLAFPYVESFDEKDPVWQLFRDLAVLIGRELSIVRFGYTRPFVVVNSDDCVEIAVQPRFRNRQVLETVRVPGSGKESCSGEESHNSDSGNLNAVEIIRVRLSSIRQACSCEECSNTNLLGTLERRSNQNVELVLQEVLNIHSNSLIFVWADEHKTVVTVQMLRRLAELDSSSNKTVVQETSVSSSCMGGSTELEW